MRVRERPKNANTLTMVVERVEHHVGQPCDRPEKYDLRTDLFIEFRVQEQQGHHRREQPGQKDAVTDFVGSVPPAREWEVGHVGEENEEMADQQVPDQRAALWQGQDSD